MTTLFIVWLLSRTAWGRQMLLEVERVRAAKAKRERRKKR